MSMTADETLHELLKAYDGDQGYIGAFNSVLKVLQEGKE